MTDVPPIDWSDTQQTTGRPEPADHPAERAILTTALQNPTLIPELAAILRDDDMAHPAHRTIWQAITDRHAQGQPVDPLLIAHDIGQDRTLAGVQGPLYLAALANDPTVITASGTHYARLVAEHGAARRTLHLATRLTQNALNGHDTALETKWIEAHLTEDNPALRTTAIPTVDQLLAHDPDDEPAWIVPDLLERGDRLILTGPEGGGKSTFLRQFAVMAAAGIHPLRDTPMGPLSVLVIDLENSTRQTRRKIRPLRVQAGHQLDPERLHIEVRIQGLDLTGTADITWLTEAVARYKPDLLITGPVYKMATGDPNEEKSAKPVAMAIDRIRADHDVAVLIEAHSAKAPAGQKRRPKEPYGWSGWMRWPEFGVHLDDDGTITHWRGQREERDWPETLRRGGTWPWTTTEPEGPEQDWAKIQNCLTAACERLSNREIGRRTGLTEATVRRRCDANSQRLAALLDHLGLTDQ